MTFVFYDPFNHVWTHPKSGAKLFQGNREASVKPAGETGAQVLAVVADNMPITAYRAEHRRKGYVKFRSAALRDVASMIPSELEWTKDHADGVAIQLLEELEIGRNVLVCCWSGYNRSGLVAALVMKKGGVDGQTAIDELRRNRSPHCLNNNLFERIVRGEA